MGVIMQSTAKKKISHFSMSEDTFKLIGETLKNNDSSTFNSFNGAEIIIDNCLKLREVIEHYSKPSNYEDVKVVLSGWGYCHVIN